LSLSARSWQPGIVAAVTVLAAWQSAAAGEPLMYVIEDDAVVFTNVPVQNARPVPGLSGADGGGETAADRLPLTIYDPYIERVARENGLSAKLIKAVALVESGFNPHAVSRAGAQGLMQLMPATAQDYGVSDAFDPLANLRAGTRHLRRLLDEFDGDLTLALAAYNAGASTVRSHNGVPDFPETVDYVSKVHEKLGRRPRGLPGSARPARVERPIRFTILEDGSVLLSN
jgi:soluble lytic murein transglycosylase-like protein